MALLGLLPLLNAAKDRQTFVTLVSMEELPVITVAFEIYKKLLELNTKLDRKYRYSLGEQTIKSWTDCTEQMLLAKHAPKPLKASYLLKANSLAEMTSLHLRAILELKLANETNVLKIQARLSEARRMTGGWLKSVQ
jgi:hypothetical protein